jgi:hypothetical protein
MAVAPMHVVLLLAVSADPSSTAVSRAAADALAVPFTEPPHVVLRTLPAAPTPTDLAALAREAKADAIVILSCAGKGCATAEVRVEGGGVEPTARSVRFGERDALGERGRAIGLLASTLLPEGWSRTAVGAAPAAPAPPAPAAAVATVAAIGSTGPPVRPGRWSADTAAALLTNTSGNVSDFGLTLAARRHLAGGWAIRAGLKLELGDLPGEAGSVRSAGALAGVEWTSPGLERPRELGFGARADVIALGRQVRPTMPIDADDASLSDLALGGDAVGLLGLALSPHAVVVAGAGVEVLGRVAGRGGDDAAVAPEPPAFRLLVELGFRARF